MLASTATDLTVRRRCHSICRLGLLIALGSTARGSALQGQPIPHSRWTTAVGFTAIRVGAREGWGYGPELSIRRDVRGKAGVELRLSLPALRENAGAAAIDLGPTWTAFRTPRTELVLSGGVTAFLAGDASELIDGGLGVYAGAQVTTWQSPRFGLTLGSRLRLTPGGAYPSFTAGIAVRF